MPLMHPFRRDWDQNGYCMCGASWAAPIHRKPGESMNPRKFASTIADLKVGMRVRHDGDLEAGTEGVITALIPRSAGVGEVKILTDERKANGYTNGRGFYYEGYESRNRKWEILHDPSAPDPSEVGVGDEIEIVTTIKGVVQRVTLGLGGRTQVVIKGAPYSSFALVEKPHTDIPSATRTWAVTAKFVPPPLAPFQAGDMAKRVYSDNVIVRQADGKWLAHNGNDAGLRDGDIAEHCVVLVRGGVKVVS